MTDQKNQDQLLILIMGISSFNFFKVSTVELLGDVKSIPDPFVVLRPDQGILNEGIVETSRKTTS